MVKEQKEKLAFELKSNSKDAILNSKINGLKNENDRLKLLIKENEQITFNYPAFDPGVFYVFWLLMCPSE